MGFDGLQFRDPHAYPRYGGVDVPDVLHVGMELHQLVVIVVHQDGQLNE